MGNTESVRASLIVHGFQLVGLTSKKKWVGFIFFHFFGCSVTVTHVGDMVADISAVSS